MKKLAQHTTVFAGLIILFLPLVSACHSMERYRAGPTALQIYMLEEDGHTTQSLLLSKKAVRKFSKSPLLHLQYGDLLLKRNDPKSAILSYRVAESLLLAFPTSRERDFELKLVRQRIEDISSPTP